MLPVASIAVIKGPEIDSLIAKMSTIGQIVLYAQVRCLAKELINNGYLL